MDVKFELLLLPLLSFFNCTTQKYIVSNIQYWIVSIIKIIIIYHHHHCFTKKSVITFSIYIYIYLYLGVRIDFFRYSEELKSELARKYNYFVPQGDNDNYMIANEHIFLFLYMDTYMHKYIVIHTCIHMYILWYILYINIFHLCI